MYNLFVTLHQVDEFFCSGFINGPVNKFLLNTTQFRKLCKKNFTPETNYEVRTIANRRISGQSTETIATAAFHANAELIKGCRLPFKFIDFNKTIKCFPNSIRDQLFLTCRLLLLENIKWLSEMGISLFKILPKI